MSVTIELKPEVEKQLAEQAAQNGLKIEIYIEVLIEEKVSANIEFPAKEKPFYEKATKSAVKRHTTRELSQPCGFIKLHIF